MKEQINKNLFNNTRLAYISKSNRDLIKSYLIFWSLNNHFFSKIGTGIKDYITGGGLIGMGIRGLTGLVNKFTGPKATEYGNLNMPGYNMLNIAGPVTRAAPTGDGEGGDGSNNQQLYAATNQYPIMGTTSEEGIETLVNNPGFIQRFRVKNPYRQDKQGQLDPAILEMINKLYT